MKRFQASLLVGLLLLIAGCAAPAPAGSSGPPVAATQKPLGAFPEMEKLFFSAAPAPLVAALDMEPQATLTIPAASRLLLAFDGDGSGSLDLTVRDPSGMTVHTARLSQSGKSVAELRTPAEGTYTIRAQSAANWQIGLVATTFPVGYVEGTRLQVSTPEQTQVEHAFVPTKIAAKSGVASRITLYDFDPHAGIENLQHDLDFPGLKLRTEGKTTWGEVRVLDLPPLAPGDYPFQCSRHGFSGTLAVA
ncbi:MAG: cupredoxin domain-containing protein [Candidatus Thermoplasmatota archaeon]